MANQRFRQWLIIVLMGVFFSASMLPAIAQAFPGDGHMTMADCGKAGNPMPCDGMASHCVPHFGCVVLPGFLPVESFVKPVEYWSNSVYWLTYSRMHGRSIAPNLEPPIL